MPALEIMPQVPSTQVETPEQWYISHSSSDACYPHRVVDRASLSPTALYHPRNNHFSKGLLYRFDFGYETNKRNDEINNSNVRQKEMMKQKKLHSMIVYPGASFIPWQQYKRGEKIKVKRGARQYSFLTSIGGRDSPGCPWLERKCNCGGSYWFYASIKEYKRWKKIIAKRKRGAGACFFFD